MRIVAPAGGAGPLGAPTDGSLLDGLTPLTSLQKVVDAVDDLNEASEAIRNGLRTTEAISLNINPSTGTDPTDSGFVTTQAQATAWGTFKTLAGAARALPNLIAENVTFLFADGNHDVETDFIEHFSRFVGITGAGGVIGKFILKSLNGLTTVPGTGVYTAAADTTSGRGFVLNADPGFTVDQHASTFARVVTGSASDVGDIRAVRSHTGVTFQIAGRWTSGITAGNTIEFVKPAARLDVDTSPFLFTDLLGSPNAQANVQVEFDAIEITSAVGGYFYMESVSVLIKGGCRFMGLQTYLFQGYADLREVVFDCKSLAPYALYSSGSVVWAANSEGSRLLRKATSVGLLVEGTISTQRRSGAWINKIAIDFCADASWIRANAVMYVHSDARSQSNTGYGAVVTMGARYYVDPAIDTFPAPQKFTGTAGDVKLDGTAVTYATMETAPDKTVIGKYGSMLLKHTETEV